MREAELVMTACRKITERPALGVIGDIEHFQASVLGKVAARYFNVVFVDRDGQASAQVFIRWTRTYAIPADRSKLPRDAFVLNDVPLNVEKTVVQHCFADVFGRDLALDPTCHHGPCVQKSIQNARHDGQVVIAPIANARADCVYERVIDNGVGDLAGEPMICDIRLPIIGGHIPFAYLKFRPLRSRFANGNTFAKLVAATDALSQIELDQCRAFAQKISLDYGEIDVLRDRPSGLIYIVDANNRPFGPPNGLHPLEADVALRLLGSAFSAAFLSDHPRQ